MGDDGCVMSKAAGLIAQGRPFVLATVIRAEGSTPRNAGAKMIWLGESAHADASATSEGGALLGTVGGGQFEHLVIDAARVHMEKRSCGVERYVLGADADQCCGGVLEVFFEYHGARQRFVVFGAGHVASELATLLETSPLELVIVDDRPEWNSPKRFPRARRVLAWEEGVRIAEANPASTLAVVMTCSHDTDFDLLRALLALREIPAFVGLIGSRSKRVCLFGRLVASGVDEALVKRVHCPIGVGDTGKEPRQVAISVAAQILMEASRLGAL